MGPAPLPPHERAWRHPSELAPTSIDVDTSGRGRGLVLITGASAVVLVAALVVALTPPRSSAPEAVSATTLPSVSVRDRNTARDIGERTHGIVRIEQSSVSRENMLTLTGAPNAVSAAPDAEASELSLARAVPEAGDRVIVLTMSHTYDIRWEEVDRIVAVPDGSIVMTRSGELVAAFIEGELSLLVP